MNGRHPNVAIARCWDIRNYNAGKRPKLGKNEDQCKEGKDSKKQHYKQEIQPRSTQKRAQNKKGSSPLKGQFRAKAPIDNYQYTHQCRTLSMF